MMRGLRPHSIKPLVRHNDPRRSEGRNRPQLYTGRWLPRLQEAEEAPKRMGFAHDAVEWKRPSDWEDF